MRGISIWLKINAAILVAFLVAATAFGWVLHHYIVDRLAISHTRTHALLVALADHPKEKLSQLLENEDQTENLSQILAGFLRVDSVSEASLFHPDGTLWAKAGEASAAPLFPAGSEVRPTGSVFSIESDQGRSSAVLVEPLRKGERTFGYLRLTYSLQAFSEFNHRLWFIFTLTLFSAYIVMAGLLNLLLHRLVLYPVKTLRQGLEAVESGRLEHRVPVLSRDALGQAAVAFNAMADRLRQTTQSLDAAQTEVEDQRRLLELRVESRTAELADTNARLMSEIGSRFRAEEERVRLLALYRAILESTAEAVICISAGEPRQVLAVNRRFLELWGLPGNWTHTDVEQKFDVILKKIRGLKETMDTFERLMHDEEVIAEGVLELEDGRFFERRSGPIRQGSVFLGRVFSYVDVTGRRQGEESLRQALAQRDALLGNSQVGLATVKGHRCLDINRHGAEILGYEREELLGQPSRLIFSDDGDFMTSWREFENRLDTIGAVSIERQLRRRDGTMIWVRAHGKAVHEGGPQLEVVWAFDDITQEKERQAKLEEARRQAEDASRAKGLFLAVMSHEIRTPLNVIMGLTELLLDQDATQSQLGHLQMIKDAVTHLIGIISDILDFSKIEAGKLVLENVDFNLLAMLEAVGKVMELQAGQKGLDFSLSVAAGVPETLRGDPGRLRQVLLNLLGNAVKFTESGSVFMAVSPAPSGDAPEGKVGIVAAIADTGIGIPPERLPDLFTSFQQGSTSIARRFGGTGLGLAISKEIVERMDGRIDVQSMVGEGSVFTCTLFMEPGDPQKVAAANKADAVAEAAADGPPLRILLVEDNILNSTVTKSHLERMGQHLTLTASAREAFAVLARERFDVVLMDIEMPDIDGISATRAIRAGGEPDAPVLDPTVPIVAVTAHAVEDVRQQCLDAGMDGFVTKPINYRLLLASLRRLDRGQFLSPLQEAVAATRPNPPATALFDPDAARETMGISWDDFAMLSQASYAEGQGLLETIKKALETGDMQRAGIAAHTFKGTAATMGAYTSRELGLTLEQTVRDGERQKVEQLLGRIERIWDRVGQALEAWQRNRDGGQAS